jgi:hypothetical protein
MAPPSGPKPVVPSASKPVVPSAPSASVAKPTPLAHHVAPVTKAITSQPVFSTGGGGSGKVVAKSLQGVAKLLAPSSEGVASGGVKGEGLATMLSQAYYSPAVLNSPQAANSLSTMLLAPSHPPPEQTTTSSTGE